MQSHGATLLAFSWDSFFRGATSCCLKYIYFFQPLFFTVFYMFTFRRCAHVDHVPETVFTGGEGLDLSCMIDLLITCRWRISGCICSHFGHETKIRKLIKRYECMLRGRKAPTVGMLLSWHEWRPARCLRHHLSIIRLLASSHFHFSSLMA